MKNKEITANREVMKKNKSSKDAVGTNPTPGHNYFRDVVSRKPAGNKLSVYVKGLSIMCPSGDGTATEIGFVKKDHKPPLIDIFGPGCSPILRYQCPEVPVRIEIQKTNFVGGSPGKKYKPGSSNDGDLDWMPDLTSTEWHGSGDPFGIDKVKAKPRLSAKLVIRDGVFFTHEQHQVKAKRTKRKNGTSQPHPPDIDTLGLVLGADIEPERTDPGFTVSVFASDGTASGENRIMFLPLPKGGGPYEISVGTQMARHSHRKDPLDLIYQFAGSKGNDKITFRMKYQDKPDEFSLCPQGGLKIKTTEFACQTFGGGDGPLPNLP